MKNTDDLILDFYLRQKEFSYLQSINLYRNCNNDGCSDYSLNIILCGYPFCEGDKKLSLTFLGVRDLKTDNLDGLYSLCIDITDISKDQMEGINYRVKEEENEVLSFYCRTFEFGIIE